MPAQRTPLEPLPKSMEQTYQFAMLGEWDRFQQDLKRLTIRLKMGSEQDEANAYNIGTLMKHLEAEKALSNEALHAISESGVMHLEFKVLVRRMISDRLVVDHDHEGFTALMQWYRAHIERYQFIENYTWLHDDYAHINLMSSKYLESEELLSTFAHEIPLTIYSAKTLLETGQLEPDKIIKAMRLDEYLYPIDDSIVLEQMYRYAKSNPAQQQNVVIANFIAYMDFVYALCDKSRLNQPALGAKVFESILCNPRSKHSSFNISGVTGYKILFDPSHAGLFEVLRRNESNVVAILYATYLEDKENPRLIQQVSPMSLKKLGTDKHAGLRDAHRDTILHLAEQGMTELAMLMSVMATHVIQDPDYLRNLAQHCGDLTEEQFVDIYMASTGDTNSSMADSNVSHLTPFLHYAQDRGWEMPWRHSYEEKGIHIISAGIQLGNLQAFIKAAQENNENSEWSIRQLNNALISMDNLLGTKYGFDLKATAEANLDRDILMQLSHYKRLCLSEDLDL